MTPTRHALLWLGVALPALSAQTSTLAQGTIVFVRPAQPIPVVYTSFPATYDLDVNGDGIPDYRFNLANGLGVTVEPLGVNRQIAVPAVPPDLGSDLDPLPAGFAVGSSLAPSYTWVSNSSPSLWGHSLLSSCVTIDGNFICTGLFSGQTAYMGIEFRIGQDAHYGWVLIDNPGGQAGGYIQEWAYETRPDTAILTGAVPEPSSVLLLLSGSGLAIWYRGKRCLK